MAKTRAQRQEHGNRAAIYARVSDKSQAEDDKTSLSEQTIEMEAYCEGKGMTITARYQEVGRGWNKKRPEFQRMLSAAKQGLFDTIVCWKSDRLSRGMYPAAALMEVVEAHQIRLEAVMDAIDMKTFGLMAAIGKIELDNFRERSSLGKRGTAKQGRIPSGGLPYGYRIGDDRRPEIHEAEAEIVRRIFPSIRPRGHGLPRDRMATDRRQHSHRPGRPARGVRPRCIASWETTATWASGATGRPRKSPPKMERRYSTSRRTPG